MGDIFQLIRWKQFLTGITFFSASFVAFTLSIVFYLHASGDLDSAKRGLMQQKSTNNNAQMQLEKYRLAAPDFEHLKNHGFVGNTKRLQWLETLAAVGEEYDIPGVNFTLADTKVAKIQKDHYFHDDLVLEVTPMAINLELVHEGDWFLFFKYLHKYSLGIFSAEQCRLDRESTSETSSFLDRLIGSCDLEWYTIADFSEDWGNDR